MKLVIAGSRQREISFGDIDKAVAKLCKRAKLAWPTEVVSGGAMGVDKIGELWAKINDIKLTVIKPDYTVGTGRTAPLIRNAKMAKYADALVAFPDAREHSGTRHMVEQMRGKKKPYLVIELRESK